MPHALISPSSWDTLLHCLGSLEAIQQWGRPDKAGSAAVLGTGVHNLIEHCINTRTEPEAYFGQTVQVESDDFGGEPIPVEIGEDEVRGARMMIDTVYALANQWPGSTLMAERKVDPAPFLGEAARGKTQGTADVTIDAVDQARVLCVVDYKNGREPVHAEDKLQLLGYAIGALADMHLERAHMVEEFWIYIVQPNCPHKDGPVRGYRYNQQQMNEWMKWIGERVALIQQPGQPRTAGEEQCRWCLANHLCPEYSKWLFESVDVGANETLPVPTDRRIQYDVVREPSELPIETVERIVDHASLLKGWLAACEEHLISLETQQPGTLSRFKLVEGTSKRRFVDGMDQILPQLLTWMEERGLPVDDVAPRSLVTPKALLAQARQKDPEMVAILSQYIEKPKGKPSLAPKDDGRQGLRPTHEELFGPPR